MDDLTTRTRYEPTDVEPRIFERWDRAEKLLVEDLRSHGFVDVFRALHGYGAREATWVYPRGGGGYRLDHVLVRDLEPVAARYRHDWREAGLSDHSGLEVELRT